MWKFDPQKHPRYSEGDPKGGQFKPKGGALFADLFGGTGLAGLFGGKTVADPNWVPLGKPKPDHVEPRPGSVKHQAKDDKGRDVYVHRPNQPTPPTAPEWFSPEGVVTVTPGSAVPKVLNGIPFEPWVPEDDDFAAGIDPTIEEGLPDLEGHKWKHAAAGVIIEEPDGRIWLTRPTNGFGGYRHTFPKGSVEPGMGLQDTAIKEAFEETGLKIEITGVLGDYERSTSVSRFFIARRVGGTPSAQGWESQAMRLIPRDKAMSFLNMSIDREILSAWLEEWHIGKARGATGLEALQARMDAVEQRIAKASPSFDEGDHPRWPKGTPLGGQFKKKDAAGFVLPVTTGAGASHDKWFAKQEAMYAAAVAGDWDKVHQLTDDIHAQAEAKGWKAAGGEMGGKFKAAQYGKELIDNHEKAITVEAKADTLAGPPSIDAYKKIGIKPGGSNPGGLYEDKKGTKYLIKGANHPSDDRAKNEVLASKLMAAVGVAAPEMRLVDLKDQYGGGLGVAAKWEKLDGWSKSNVQHLEAVRDEFAVHAWLANYDAVGSPPGDNLAMKDGQPFNPDPGGALLYRAQGVPKDLPGGMLSNDAPEWESMRSAAKNAAAHSIYGGMSAADLQKSAQKLLAVDDKTIDTLVDTYGPGNAAKKAKLAAALKARKQAILKKSGVLAAEPASVASGFMSIAAKAEADIASGGDVAHLKPSAAAAEAKVSQNSPSEIPPVVYLTHTGEGHNKFWKAEVKGTELVKSWGKIGTKGQSQSVNFMSSGAALMALQEQTAAKQAKGYDLKSWSDAAGVAPPSAGSVDGKVTQNSPPVAYTDNISAKGKELLANSLVNIDAHVNSNGLGDGSGNINAYGAKVFHDKLANAKTTDDISTTLADLKAWEPKSIQLQMAKATMVQAAGEITVTMQASAPKRFGPGNKPGASDFMQSNGEMYVPGHVGVGGFLDQMDKFQLLHTQGNLAELKKQAAFYQKMVDTGVFPPVGGPDAPEDKWTGVLTPAGVHNNGVKAKYLSGLAADLEAKKVLPDAAPNLAEVVDSFAKPSVSASAQAYITALNVQAKQGNLDQMASIVQDAKDDLLGPTSTDQAKIEGYYSDLKAAIKYPHLNAAPTASSGTFGPGNPPTAAAFTLSEANAAVGSPEGHAKQTDELTKLHAAGDLKGLKDKAAFWGGYDLSYVTPSGKQAVLIKQQYANALVADLEAKAALPEKPVFEKNPITGYDPNGPDSGWTSKLKLFQDLHAKGDIAQLEDWAQQHGATVTTGANDYASVNHGKLAAYAQGLADHLKSTKKAGGQYGSDRDKDGKIHEGDAKPGMKKLTYKEISAKPKISWMGIANSGPAKSNVNMAITDGYSALQAGDINQLQAAYTKLTEVKLGFSFGSKGRAKVAVAQAWLVDNASKAGLKISGGKFEPQNPVPSDAQMASLAANVNSGVQTGGLAAVNAAAPKDAALKVLKATGDMMADVGVEQLNWGATLPKPTLAAVTALQAGDDKAMATALGELGMIAGGHGSPTPKTAAHAQAIYEHLQQYAVIKGGMPLSAGGASASWTPGLPVFEGPTAHLWKSEAQALQGHIALGNFTAADALIDKYKDVGNIETTYGAMQKANADKFVAWGKKQLGYPATDTAEPLPTFNLNDEGEHQVNPAVTTSTPKPVFKDDGAWAQYMDQFDAADAAKKATMLAANVNLLNNSSSGVLDDILVHDTKAFVRYASEVVGHMPSPELAAAVVAVPAKPQFTASTPTAVAYYDDLAGQMEKAFEAGDMANLLAAGQKKNGKPVWPVFETGAKKGQPKTTNGKMLSEYQGALMTALSAKTASADAAALAQPVAAPPAEGTNKGDLPAMPVFDKHKVPDTNTNSASHNKKVETIAALAKKGDVKGILGLNYGTNTYGKKQAAVANDALAALGSNYKVDVGQKKGAHPALAATNFNPAGEGKSAKLTAKDMPDPLNFQNWNGAGKGLSSKDWVNAANQQVHDKLFDLAKAGDMNGVKNLTFAELSADGTPTGKALPVEKHPSQHIKNLQQSLLQAMDEKLNPPKPLEIFEAKQAAASIDKLAKSMPPKPWGTHAHDVPSSQSLGYMLAVGQVKGHEALVPKAELEVSPTFKAKAKSDYQKMSSMAHQFISQIQGSGGHPWHEKNWKSGNQKKLTDWAIEAHHYARELPPGTTVHKHLNLSADMKAKLKAAQPGLIIQNPAPMCTSYGKSMTSGFGNDYFKITLAPGAKLMGTFGSGSYASEGELTTLPNARFVVLSSNGQTTHLLLLPPDPFLDQKGSYWDKHGL